MIFLVHGECLKNLKELDDNSVDALITDPPAGISFMNKAWDDDKGGRNEWINWMSEIMTECLRVIKPGSHGLIWAIPRTSHWTATALENAGFEVRDVVTHLFSTGFPKSLNISKAIDKEFGIEREPKPLVEFNGRIHKPTQLNSTFNPNIKQSFPISENSCNEAKKYDGWGTGLKPASEHWILVRKPLTEKTIAKNVLKYGTGGINIDACRVKFEQEDRENYEKKRHSFNNSISNKFFKMTSERYTAEEYIERSSLGRFPANLVLSHNQDCECIGTKEVKTKATTTSSNHTGLFDFGGGEKVPNLYLNENGKETVSDYKCTEGCAVKALDEQSGILKSGNLKAGSKGGFHIFKTHSKIITKDFKASEGGASRFFYCSKASKTDKGEDNSHPTPKNTKLMEYLIKLIAPENGIVLDPFMGSGSTAIACINLKKEFIGIEKELEYFNISKKRAENLSEDIYCF